MTLALRDELFDAQFVRALAYAGQSGADIGECFGTAEVVARLGPNGAGKSTTIDMLVGL